MALQISPLLGQPIYPFQEASNSTRQQPSLASPTSAPFFSFNYGFHISFLIKSLISSIYQDSLTLAISLLDFPLTIPKSNNVFSSLLKKKKKIHRKAQFAKASIQNLRTSWSRVDIMLFFTTKYMTSMIILL